MSQAWIPSWGRTSQDTQYLNCFNTFFFYCFHQEHYSRLEEKFWNSKTGNRKLDSLSSACSSRGWTWRLNWFNTSGWPIYLPGGTWHCPVVSWLTASIWPFCVWTIKVIFVGRNSKEEAWGVFVMMEQFLIFNKTTLK